MAWGSAQEAGTVATLMLHHPECVCEEVGLCCVDVDRWRDEWGLGAVSVPPVGASPDAIVQFPTSSFGQSSDNRSDDDTAGGGWERLVVEVKNHSPFRRDPSGKSGVFYVDDRTPFETPPPYHVPQLQMEMLAADTTAGLLCMQSATRGIRVFRIERDDEYCAGMLRTLGAMHEEYVLRGREPRSGCSRTGTGTLTSFAGRLKSRGARRCGRRFRITRGCPERRTTSDRSCRRAGE